jgi:hypothetical protein
MNPKADRTEYLALLARIRTGELSRREAAAQAHLQTGLSPSTFMSWLSSTRAIKELKDTRLSAGQNSHFASKDPDKVKAYDDAVSAVLGGLSGPRAAEKFGVNYQYLMQKVKQARPPKKRSLSPKEDLIEALTLASRAGAAVRDSTL